MPAGIVRIAFRAACHVPDSQVLHNEMFVLLHKLAREPVHGLLLALTDACPLLRAGKTLLHAVVAAFHCLREFALQSLGTPHVRRAFVD